MKLAVEYRTPVLLLSDGYLGNGAEPWPVPDLTALPAIEAGFTTEPNRQDGSYAPYARDEKLARSWAAPGTPGLEHRIGGLEKADGTGAISYDAENHDRMVRLRQAKVEGIADILPPVAVDDPSGQAKVLVLGWGSTFGPIQAAARAVRSSGRDIAIAHLRHLNPLPHNVGEVLRAYDRVVVPEMNLGQLAMWLRAKYLVPVEGFNQITGLPLRQSDLAEHLQAIVDEEAGK